MKEFKAQLGKDLKLIWREALLWAVLLALLAVSYSPRLLGWAAGAWSPEGFDRVLGFLAVGYLGLFLLYWVMLARLLFADTPLRITAFWRSRPVGAVTLTASKVVIALGLAIATPLLCGALVLLPSGGGSGLLEFWTRAAVLLSMQGVCVLAVVALFPNARALLIGLGAVFVLFLVFSITLFQGGGYNPGFESASLGLSRLFVVLLTLVLGAIGILWLQYRQRRFLPGLGAACALGMVVVVLANVWSIDFLHRSVPANVQVGEPVTDPNSMDVMTGGFNDIEVVRFSFKQRFPEAGEGILIAPTGVESRLVSDKRSQNYGGPLYEPLTDQAAEALGLTRESGEVSADTRIFWRGAYSKSVFAQNAAKLYQPGEQFLRLEGTMYYRVYRLREPLKLRVTGDHAHWESQWAYLVDRSVGAQNSLNMDILWLGDTESHSNGLTREMMVVNPETGQWWDNTSGGFSGGGHQVFRGLYFHQSELSIHERTERVDGEYVSFLSPSPEWIAQAEIWLPVVEFLGTHKHDFSIDLRPFQHGEWLAFPQVNPPHQEGYDTRIEISLLNLKEGETTGLGFGLGEDVTEWSVMWYGQATLLVWSSDDRFKAYEPQGVTNRFRDRKPTEPERAAMKRARLRHPGNGMIPAEFGK